MGKRSGKGNRCVNVSMSEEGKRKLEGPNLVHAYVENVLASLCVKEKGGEWLKKGTVRSFADNIHICVTMPHWCSAELRWSVLKASTKNDDTDVSTTCVRCKRSSLNHLAKDWYLWTLLTIIFFSSI